MSILCSLNIIYNWLTIHNFNPENIYEKSNRRRFFYLVIHIEAQKLFREQRNLKRFSLHIFQKN